MPLRLKDHQPPEACRRRCTNLHKRYKPKLWYLVALSVFVSLWQEKTMNHKYLLILLLLISPSFLFAKNTIVTGTAPAYSGMTIRLSTYEDFVSYKEYLLASDQIDDLGNFRLTFDINTTTYAFLNLDFRRSDIYIIPGCFYDIKIKSPEAKQTNVNPFLAEESLEFEIIHAPDDDITLLIQDLNLEYNTFIADKNNFYALYRKRDKSKLEDFKSQISKKFPNPTNPYFQNVIKYKIASLEDLARIKSRKKLFDEYFLEQPILYNHVEYMEFFNQYFNNYLISSKQINYDMLRSSINDKGDYFSFLKIVGMDTLLSNEKLRELVMLKGLKDLASNPEFNQSNVIRILKDFSEKMKYAEHRNIAGNIVFIKTKLKPGTMAPEFSVKDVEGNLIHLKDFRGKYIYLCFWTSWCIPCVKEFEILSELYPKYRNEVKFLGISFDKEYSSMYHNLNEKKYPWANFHYDNDLDLIEDYEIKTYPLFVLIDREGKIIRYPAPSPSQNLENIIGKLLFEESRK